MPAPRLPGALWRQPPPGGRSRRPLASGRQCTRPCLSITRACCRPGADASFAALRTARASSAGFSGITNHFRAVLAGAGVKVDDKVVVRVLATPALAVQLQLLSTTAEAIWLYHAAERIPQSTTRAIVLRETGIVVDGDIQMPHITTSLFFWALRGSVPHVLKIPARQIEAPRECELYSDVGNDAEMGQVALVPVKAISLRGSHRSRDDDSDALPLTGGVLMPHYPMTFAQLPALCVQEAGVAIFDRISAALAFLADKGWLHGDVKPSNIFIDARGNAWLGDYGTSRRIEHAMDTFTGGTPSFQVTEIPCDASHGAFDFAGLVVSFVVALGLLQPGARDVTPWPLSAIQAAVARAEPALLRGRLERTLARLSVT